MSRPSDRRPPGVTALVVVLTFLGKTALGGAGPATVGSGAAHVRGN